MDLLKLRLKTAQSYLNLLSDGTVAANFNNALRVHANVEGLGPQFRIELTIENLGNNPLKDLIINYSYNTDVFKFVSFQNKITYLIPNISYCLRIICQNVDPNGASDAIKIFICEKEKSTPIIAAVVTMPISELKID